MDWVGFVLKHRMWLAAGLALVGHLVMAAVVLSVPLSVRNVVVEVISVDLVVMPPRKIEPESKVLPEPELVTALPAKARTSMIEPAAPPTDRSGEAASEVPFVALSGLVDPDETIVPRGEVVVVDPLTGVRRPEGVMAGTRLALRIATCQRLVEHRDPTCPKENPFEFQARIAAAKNAPPLQRVGAGSHAPGNFAEAFLAKNKGYPPRMLSGEDNSTFIDPMAQGAYNAQRIRNGDAPVWDDDFTRELEQMRK